MGLHGDSVPHLGHGPGCMMRPSYCLRLSTLALGGEEYTQRVITREISCLPSSESQSAKSGEFCFEASAADELGVRSVYALYLGSHVGPYLA